MSVQIREHRLGRDLDEFIRFPYELYRDDPAYIAPLELEIRDRLTPKKNPFFEHGEAVLFTAWRDGKCVGRISAQIDREHVRIHEEKCGSFGFFDTIDDQEVATSLLDAAEAWLRSRGMTVMRGPFSLSINEDVGVLVDGFENPPVIGMAHSRAWQHKLIEGAGLVKAMDFYAWKYVVEPPPERAQKAWEQITSYPEVQFRSVKKARLRKELDIILDIFNDAWRHNWGFVPATESEINKMAEDMGLVLDEDLAFFATVNGREVAICVAIPNLMEAVADFHGKLFPFNVFKLLWRVKVKHPKSARLMILGIREDMRHLKKYGGLSHAMYAELARRGMAKGYEWAELGWTLEINKPINLGIKSMRGKVYKTYRAYERPIASAKG